MKLLVNDQEGKTFEVVLRAEGLSGVLTARLINHDRVEMPVCGEIALMQDDGSLENTGLAFIRWINPECSHPIYLTNSKKPVEVGMGAFDYVFQHNGNQYLGRLVKAGNLKCFQIGDGDPLITKYDMHGYPERTVMTSVIGQAKPTDYKVAVTNTIFKGALFPIAVEPLALPPIYEPPPNLHAIKAGDIVFVPSLSTHQHTAEIDGGLLCVKIANVPYFIDSEGHLVGEKHKTVFPFWMREELERVFGVKLHIFADGYANKEKAQQWLNGRLETIVMLATTKCLHPKEKERVEKQLKEEFKLVEQFALGDE